MTDITDIKRGLASRALSVAQMLLPNGKKEGPEWRAGSVDGEKGKSLGVHLTGAKAGIWSDFSTGETGDLLDLWCEARGINLGDAIKQAREYLGMEQPKWAREPKKKFRKPVKPALTVPRARALGYLRENRNLSDKAISAYKIGETTEVYRLGRDDDAVVLPTQSVVFPFIEPDGNLAMIKLRAPEDGARPIPTSGSCKRILFGWQAINENDRTISIVEGEIDAPSGWEYGYPCLSVPFGGGGGAKQAWIENEFDRMERFEAIYLALDDDDEGDVAAEEIAGRLGRHRCLRVRLPKKDFNKCLVDGVSKEEIDAAYAKAETLDPAGLNRPTQYTDDVAALLWPDDGVQPGYTLPYENLRDKIHFRPSELTVWQGKTGSGKTQMLSDCQVDWVEQGARTCLASLEMTPAQTLRRMVKQVLAVDRPTPEFVDKGLVYLDQGLLLYDRVGKSDIETILDVFDYARAKYGCDVFVIDSLMRLGIAKDDYAAQEQAVFRMVDWVLARNVHIHLVAHSRKGGKEDSGPEGTEDIRGAGEIGDNAFNVIGIWRDRRHEDEIANATSDEARAELLEKPGVRLTVSKQRNGDFEGKKGLWFDQKTYRYRSSKALPRNYVPASGGVESPNKKSTDATETIMEGDELEDIFG